jgi:hypothetical protein
VDPTTEARVGVLVNALITSAIDGPALKAALGERPAPLRPPRSGVALLELTGVLTPSDSLFTMLGCGPARNPAPHVTLWR